MSSAEVSTLGHLQLNVELHSASSVLQCCVGGILRSACLWRNEGPLLETFPFIKTPCEQTLRGPSPINATLAARDQTAERIHVNKILHNTLTDKERKKVVAANVLDNVQQRVVPCTTFTGLQIYASFCRTSACLVWSVADPACLQSFFILPFLSEASPESSAHRMVSPAGEVWCPAVLTQRMETSSQTEGAFSQCSSNPKTIWKFLESMSPAANRVESVQLSSAVEFRRAWTSIQRRQNTLLNPEVHHGPPAHHSLVLESSQKLSETSTLCAGHTLTDLTMELSGLKRAEFLDLGMFNRVQNEPTG
ncbi:hypothetical protein FQN60_012882 [Etheostoma spectabile]|uniref:Uncharacterized protein n=1 Tax=Etheostoma spectabile TaxID=54343 RepID=A0A5J5D618_9PERO|nr:hypothetical protein FQN60_012882 [Etheostoma spectabile]